MIGIPVFMDAKNLQVLVAEDLRHVIKKVEYRNKLSEVRKSHFANWAKKSPHYAGGLEGC